MSDFELKEHEAVIERCLTRARPLERNVCKSAINYLRRAWRLREVDREMAMFCCITGEEEAVRALCHSLRKHGYDGAERLNYRSHDQKAVVPPVLQAIGESLRDMQGFSASIVFDRHVSGDDPRVRVRVLMTAADGTPLAVYPDPPLDAKASV